MIKGFFDLTDYDCARILDACRSSFIIHCDEQYVTIQDRIKLNTKININGSDCFEKRVCPAKGANRKKRSFQNFRGIT